MALRGLSLPPGPSTPPVPKPLGAPGELLGLDPGAWHLILDTDAISIEDVGLVRHFSRSNPITSLTLTGIDDRGRVARTLLGLSGARWLPWPPDIEQVQDLLTHDPRPTAGQPSGSRQPNQETVPPKEEATLASPQDPAAEHPPWDLPVAVDGPGPLSELRELEDDLEAIEQILTAGPMGSGESPVLGPGGSSPKHDPGSMALTAEEVAAFFDPGPTEETQVSPSGPPTAPAEATTGPVAPGLTPPTWYKDQVADLADWAQRLSLAGSPTGFQDQALAQDVLGLTQFARTLGFLAAPPPRGDQKINLETMLEELLAGLAGAREGSPRYLFRPNPGAMVLSDKVLLCTALDALLQLADACCGSTDVVRVSLQTSVEPAEHRVQIQFPSGPLSSLPPGEALAPYALKKMLPQIGPNALAAAGRILQGQGGDLAIGEGSGPGERLLQATLPSA